MAVVALEPADTELDEENEVEAPAPDGARRCVRLNIQARQLARIFLKLGLRFQNYVILVELRVHRADLPLPVGVIKRVVDGERSYAQA